MILDTVLLMGPRGAIHVNHLQVPCGAFLRWDLSWRELVNVTNSYVDSTRFFDLDLFNMWVVIWFNAGIKNNLLGLMVLDLW
jgi:hypothetical protein